MLRRVKDEVECKLPPKLETRINCPLSEFQTVRIANLDRGMGMGEAMGSRKFGLAALCPCLVLRCGLPAMWHMHSQAKQNYAALQFWYRRLLLRDCDMLRAAETGESMPGSGRGRGRGRGGGARCVFKTGGFHCPMVSCHDTL